MVFEFESTFIEFFLIFSRFRTFGFVVVDGCGLHLDGVVPVPQLRQSEASHVVQAVDTVEEFVVVALRPKLEHRPAKQVELDGHLGRHGRVDHSRKLVGGKYSEEGIQKLSLTRS